MLPEPPAFAMYQEEPTRLNGVYAAQAARPQAQEERRDQQEQARNTVSHRLPFPSLVHEAWRRVAVWRNTQDLLHIIQDNPLKGNSHAHHSGARACQDICTKMETLEDALEQLLWGRQSPCFEAMICCDEFRKGNRALSSRQAPSPATHSGVVAICTVEARRREHSLSQFFLVCPRRVYVLVLLRNVTPPLRTGCAHVRPLARGYHHRRPR